MTVGGLVLVGGQSAAVLELGEASLDEVSEDLHMTFDPRLSLAVFRPGMTTAMSRASRSPLMKSAP